MLGWGVDSLLWSTGCGTNSTVGVSSGEGGGTFPKASILGKCIEADDEAEVERNDDGFRLSGRVRWAAALWRLTRGRRAGGGG